MAYFSMNLLVEICISSHYRFWYLSSEYKIVHDLIEIDIPANNLLVAIFLSIALIPRFWQ